MSSPTFPDASHDEGDYGPYPTLSSIVVTTCDAQFLRDKNGKLIKEFAVYCPGFRQDTCSVVTFAPPYEKECLPKSIRRQNYFATNNFHGLEWNDGECGYKYVTHMLSKMTQNFNVLYVKGTEKTKVLQSFMPHLKVLNIEELGCPSFEKLPLFDALCQNEIHNEYPRCSCAVKNAKRLSIWLQFYLCLNV